MAAKKTFESAMEELEKIVDELETTDADLDKSISLFEKGMKLSSFCKEKLDAAEQKAKILLSAEGDNPTFADMPDMNE